MPKLKKSDEQCYKEHFKNYIMFKRNEAGYKSWAEFAPRVCIKSKSTMHSYVADINKMPVGIARKVCKTLKLSDADKIDILS